MLSGNFHFNSDENSFVEKKFDKFTLIKNKKASVSASVLD